MADKIGSVLTSLREKRKLNKAQVARQLGISSQLLGQYESGRQQPKTEFILKWKNVFGEDLFKYLETNVSRETTNGVPDAGVVEVLKENNQDLRNSNHDLRTNNQFLQRMLETNLDKLTLAVSTLAGLSKEQISTLASEASGDISGPFQQLKKKRSGSGSGIRK
jgi:transcriptional regulator with XRE-family HTH domain